MTGGVFLLNRSGIVPDGIVREYYGNGALRKTVSFKDG
jgi:antitoxin component YwqK of YwqJK toxin-antitoxin module